MQAWAGMLVMLLLCGGLAAPGTGLTHQVPVGYVPWRRASGGWGYSLLLGLVDAAPKVGDL